MNCLFIFPDAPLTPDYSEGGAARYSQAFEALTLLGHGVHVLRLIEKSKLERLRAFESNLPADAQRNHQCAMSWRDVLFENKYHSRYRTKLEGMAKGILAPIDYAYPHARSLIHGVREAIKQTKPDIVLAEMMPAGAVLAAAQLRLPWIYGHHDWEYRVRQVRNASYVKKKTLGRRFTNGILRYAEHRVVKQSSGVIAASLSEANEIQRLGVKNCVTIPVTYPSVPFPPNSAMPHHPLRIVHFANLQRSVNTDALSEYLTHVSALTPSQWEFVVVGATNGAPESLLNRLSEMRAQVLGFVRDLATVLRPYDVAVVPYRYNTGERTRVIQLFNHSQVVVTTRAAVEGSPFLQAGHNCVVVDSLSDFPSALQKLADNPDLRRQIGLAAKATFEEQLTLDAQLPLFKQVIDGALESHQTRHR